MNQTTRKILILSCGTGEGHNSAARAIEQTLIKRGIPCELRDSIAFKSEAASRRATNGYSFIIRKITPVFGWAFVLGDLYDRMRLPSPIYAVNATYAKKVYKYIVENQFNMVICTHLYAMETMTAVRKKFKLDIPCYGVLTDYTDIPFYKDTKLDGYFVATEHVKQRLIKKRFSPDIVHITGIPVHPKLNKTYDRAELCARLDIPEDKKVVVVMSGGAGCGKVLKLCRSLDKKLGDDYLIIAFPGRNEKLKDKLDVKFAGSTKLRAFAFTPDIDLYLRLASVVISKPGGLSSTEIAVLNVPLVHIKGIPVLEKANSDFFTAHGMSLYARNYKQAAEQAVKLLADPELMRQMSENQRNTINAYAADDIIDKVTEDFEVDGILLDPADSRRIVIGQSDVLQDNTEHCETRGRL